MDPRSGFRPWSFPDAPGRSAREFSRHGARSARCTRAVRAEPALEPTEREERRHHADGAPRLGADQFALIFRVVPDARIAWRDAAVGGAVTALLFVLGKLAVGLYLGRGGIGSAYGAAGALLVLLVWIYYSAQILFLGAEFTQVFANRHGARVRPVRGASVVSEARRPEEGRSRRGAPEREPRPSHG